MSRSALLAALAAFAFAAPAAAQVRPQPGNGDPHIQTIGYDAGQVVLLELAPGYQMTVELAADEQIENVAVGDSGAWQVSTNRRGDRLFVKLLQPGVSTNMTVITNVRVYMVELAPLYAPTPEMAYFVRFNYPDVDNVAQGGPDPAVEGRYRLSGERSLRPVRIGDDGIHTYIEWPAEAVLPAVYSLDSTGRETLVNGMMRDELFVLDSVSSRLVFRIDKRVARAERVTEGKKR